MKLSYSIPAKEALLKGINEYGKFSFDLDLSTVPADIRPIFAKWYRSESDCIEVDEIKGFRPQTWKTRQISIPCDLRGKNDEILEYLYCEIRKHLNSFRAVWKDPTEWVECNDLENIGLGAEELFSDPDKEVSELRKQVIAIQAEKQKKKINYNLEKGRSPKNYINKNEFRHLWQIPEISEDLNKTLDEAEKKYEENEARKEELKRLSKEKKQQEEDDRKIFIKSFIEKHGTDEQVDRYLAGFLPESELEGIFRDEAFKSLSFTSFRKITKSEVLDAAAENGTYYGEDQHGYEPEVEFYSREITELTADEFSQFNAIKSILNQELAKGKIEKFELEITRHSGGLTRNDSWDVQRQSVKVDIWFNGFHFSRRYALD